MPWLGRLPSSTRGPGGMSVPFHLARHHVPIVVAVVSGVVGYFLVLRGQTFAGHALGHIGFAGATGAVLIGVAPIWGLVGLTVEQAD